MRGLDQIVYPTEWTYRGINQHKIDHDLPDQIESLFPNYDYYTILVSIMTIIYICSKYIRILIISFLLANGNKFF